MLQSMGLQRVGHSLATEQQQTIILETVHLISSFLVAVLTYSCHLKDFLNFISYSCDSTYLSFQCCRVLIFFKSLSSLLASSQIIPEILSL